MKILQVWLAMSTSIRQWALQRPVEGGAAPLRLRVCFWMNALPHGFAFVAGIFRKAVVLAQRVGSGI